MSKLGKKIEIRVCVFTYSVKLEKWTFHVADLPRTGKKCIEIKTGREGCAKLLFLVMKYVKFVPCRCSRLFASKTRKSEVQANEDF